jgi:AcrR family transcriptional regulator
MAGTNSLWATEVGLEPVRRELAPTAARILKAARRVLLKKGYSALTMQEIERESGTNRALVHYYFGSKAGLVDALVETLFEDPAFGYSDEVMQAPEGEQRRKALLGWLLRIVRDHRSARLLYELLPQFLRSAKLRAHVADLYEAYREFDGRCLASGVSGLDQSATRRLGALSVAVVEGLGVQLAVDPQGFDEGGAYALWEEMVAAYLERKERATQATVEAHSRGLPPEGDTAGREGLAIAGQDGAERRDGEKG